MDGAMDDEDPFEQLSSSPSIDEEEIDFQYVYALRSFVATEQGQANAFKGDAMILLNDANSYWWLVRLVKDSSVGFLPAEHIETPWERLARLNKHRNGDLCSASTAGLNSATKSFGKMFKSNKSKKQAAAKSVSFNNNTTYVSASEYEYSDDADDEGELESESEDDMDYNEEEEQQHQQEQELEMQEDKAERPQIEIEKEPEPLVINKTRDSNPNASMSNGATTTTTTSTTTANNDSPTVSSPTEQEKPEKKKGFFGLMSKISKNNNQIMGEDLGASLMATSPGGGGRDTVDQYAPPAPAPQEDDKERAKRRSLLKSKSSVEQFQSRSKKSASQARPSSPEESSSSSSSFSLFKRKKSREQLDPLKPTNSNSSASVSVSSPTSSLASSQSVPSSQDRVSPIPQQQQHQQQQYPQQQQQQQQQQYPQQRGPPQPPNHQQLRERQLSPQLPPHQQRLQQQSSIQPLQIGANKGYNSITESRYPLPKPRNVSMQSQSSVMSAGSIQSESGFQAAGLPGNNSTSRHPASPPIMENEVSNSIMNTNQRARYPPPRYNNQQQRQSPLKRQSVPVAFNSPQSHSPASPSAGDGSQSSILDGGTEWTREHMWNTKRRSDIQIGDGGYMPYVGLDEHSHDYQQKQPAVPKRYSNSPQHYSKKALSPQHYQPSDASSAGSIKNAPSQSLPPLDLSSIQKNPAPLAYPPPTENDTFDETHNSSRELDELINDAKLTGKRGGGLGAKEYLPSSLANEKEPEPEHDHESDSDVIVTGSRSVDIETIPSTVNNDTASWVTEQQSNGSGQTALINSSKDQYDEQWDKYDQLNRSYSSQSQSDSFDSTVAPSSTINTASTQPTPVMLNGSERSHSSTSNTSPPCFDDRENESPVSEHEDSSNGTLLEKPAVPWNNKSDSPLKTTQLSSQRDGEEDQEAEKSVMKPPTGNRKNLLETKNLHARQEPAETHDFMMNDLHPEIVPIFKDTSDRLGMLSNKLDALLSNYR